MTHSFIKVGSSWGLPWLSLVKAFSQSPRNHEVYAVGYMSFWKSPLLTRIYHPYVSCRNLFVSSVDKHVSDIKGLFLLTHLSLPAAEGICVCQLRKQRYTILYTYLTHTYMLQMYYSISYVLAKKCLQLHK